MKKFLILQMRPENETADSEFEAILRAGEIDREQVHRIRLEQPGELEKFEFDPNHYCAIIAGGSPFDVSSPDNKKSDTQRRIESFFNALFDQILDNDFPFLGACSGSGLLGRYCGATISGKYSEPVGSVTVALTAAGQKDALLEGLPGQFTAMVGHKEACEEVPDGAVHLITSGPCPVQMFRIKQNVYATQFHPEADFNEFVLRINIYKHYGYFPPERAEELIEAMRGIETPVTREILRRFAARYRYRPATEHER
jgi:GMP synthase (glutamine-hydrolysing)